MHFDTYICIYILMDTCTYIYIYSYMPIYMLIIGTVSAPAKPTVVAVKEQIPAKVAPPPPVKAVPAPTAKVVQPPLKG
jgi:hypothetical protein